MTIEYILLLFAVFFIAIKVFMLAPREAFKNSGPHLAARLEKELESGQGFKPKGKDIEWKKPGG